MFLLRDLFQKDMAPIVRVANPIVYFTDSFKASKDVDVIFRNNVIAAVRGRNNYLVTAREYLRSGY